MGEGAGLRVCLISGVEEEERAGAPSAALAAALAARHDVALIHLAGSSPEGAAGPDVREIVATPSEDLVATLFPNEEYRRSAAALGAIAAAYGDRPPDYLEAPDRAAPALVPLQARRACHPSLRGTRIALRLVGSEELIRLHDASLGEDGASRICDLEREQLRIADGLVWPGGAGLDLYRRYYPEPLPRAARVGIPLDLPPESPAPVRSAPDGPLRILCCGPIGRGAGTADLAEACLRLPRDDWRLTIVGPDTATAIFKLSMRATLEAMFADDPRVTFHDSPPAERMRALISEHDLLVAPPRFAVWPTEVIEAMACGLPVLATPVGGLVEIVEDGVTGWLAADTGPRAIGAALVGLLERREEVERVRGTGAPAERAARLADPEAILDGYDRLFEDLGCGTAPRRPKPEPARGPLVSAIVPYYGASAHVEEAVDSAFAQTHPDLEVVIVNDGSFEEEDEILDRLAARPGVRVLTQLNAGEAAARNFGIAMARGEYVLMLDADNVLEPEFVARALEVFRNEPGLGYVGSWLRYIEPDGSPLAEPSGGIYLGNRVLRHEGSENWDGDTFALLPRRMLLDLGFFHEPEGATHADWEFFRRLRDEGRFGLVIPEKLIRYRVRPDSLMRSWTGRIRAQTRAEMEDRRIRAAFTWTGEG
ncbi:MAG TPA: glycosyltransferase [Solirubrobacterales bacterium]